MSAATFLPLAFDAASINVTGAVVANSVEATTTVVAADVLASDDVSAGDDLSVSGDAAVVGELSCNGNALMGNAAGDTFKTHGATGVSGAQSAFLASPASPGAVYSEPEADAVRDAVVACLDCLKNHGLMASS